MEKLGWNPLDGEEEINGKNKEIRKNKKARHLTNKQSKKPVGCKKIMRDAYGNRFD